MGGVPGVSRACDRFPSKFQNFERHCSKTALYDVKCGFTAVALKILKTCMGAYRSLFLIEMSNAAEKISIEDGVYVAGSQNSLKVGENISEKKWKIRVFKKWAFFGRKKVVIFRFPWVRTASLGFPGVKKRRKNEFYIQKKIEFCTNLFTMKKLILR